MLHRAVILESVNISQYMIDADAYIVISFVEIQFIFIKPTDKQLLRSSNHLSDGESGLLGAKFYHSKGQQCCFKPHISI